VRSQLRPANPLVCDRLRPCRRFGRIQSYFPKRRKEWNLEDTRATFCTMTSSSIVWAARGQSAWKSTSLRHQFHAPSLNSCGLFEFHLAEAQLDPSTCFGRHGSATDKKEDTFPPYTSQTNTSYRSQLSGRRPLHTPQPFPGSKHKKTWLLTIQCCLTVNSIGPHAIASFLDRCLLEMDMAHAIPGSDPSLKHVAKFVLSTKTDTSLRQIHDLTEQNPNTK